MLMLNCPRPSVFWMNWNTPDWNAPVPLSSTRMAICIGAVAGCRLTTARSLPPSLTVMSAAVRSVTGAPLESVAEI